MTYKCEQEKTIKFKLKKAVKIILPLSAVKKIKIVREFLYFHINTVLGDKAKEGAERKASLGEKNPDKKIWIVRKETMNNGLLTCYVSALGQLKKADSKNYIPVIDMKTKYFPGAHNSEEDVNKINAWEQYFMPLSDISVEDAYKSKNVLLGPRFVKSCVMELYDYTLITKELLKKWQYLDNKYMRLKPELLEEFQSEANRLLSGKKCLGVMLREGYALLDKERAESGNAPVDISGHPKQPSFEEMAGMIKEKMKLWNCEYVFFVGETENAVNFMKEKFPGKVIVTERKRPLLKKYTLEESENEIRKIINEISVVNKNIDYLKEVYLLSECNCILAGKCSGSIVAAIWNQGKYENFEILKMGLY